MEVVLEQMLAARETRAMRQTSLHREYGLPMISFCMNIPGPVKDTPLIRRGFLSGCAMLDAQLPGEAIRYRQVFPAVTGWEAFYVLDLPALQIKKITTVIEDSLPLGRLFDMDVLTEDLTKLDRDEVGGKSRDCIVCGAAGRGCASRRTHSVAELQQATREILTRHFAREDAERIGAQAVQSLLDEVDTTPKPGLVDRRNNGSHKDMDRAMFYASARALQSYFHRCARIGMQTAAQSPQATFHQLRTAGLQAEQEMFAVTGGVNTHKGAIFTLGLLCGAAGRLWNPVSGWDPDALCAEVARMTASTILKDFEAGQADTVGRRLFAERGIQGIRGEVARGLPSVGSFGLPLFLDLTRRGLSAEQAGAVTLLHLICRVEDTNLIGRGGPEGAGQAREQVQSLLEAQDLPSREQLEALDDWFIARNLSPGGCADLLAAIYFVKQLACEGQPD